MPHQTDEIAKNIGKRDQQPIGWCQGHPWVIRPIVTEEVTRKELEEKGVIEQEI